MKSGHNSHSPIFIMGYMACGKTTFGKALGHVTGRMFIDLDFRIEQRFHTTVSEIFHQWGEDRFRAMETAMLQEVSDMEDVIISCGGGTPCFNNNMDVMLEKGHTVWLQASPGRIVRRLLDNRSKRPLMADKKPEELMEAVTAGLDARLSHYQRAEIHFDGDSLDNKSQIDTAIHKFIDQYPRLFLGEKELNS